MSSQVGNFRVGDIVTCISGYGKALVTGSKHVVRGTATLGSQSVVFLHGSEESWFVERFELAGGGLAPSCLNLLARHVHEAACAKGWWDGGVTNVPEKLALVHSEVSEALEDYWDGKMETSLGPSGKPCGFGSELADVLIRVLDLAAALNIDIDTCVRDKVSYNSSHGGKHA